MNRPVQPLNTYGAIAVRPTGTGRYTAGARYRDDDGAYSRITATGTTRPGAINALKAKIADHHADGGGELNRATTLTALAEFWLAEVRTSGTQAPQTIDAYEHNLRTVLLPALGRLRLREVTVGRIDRFLKKIATDRPSHATRARVVLSLLLALAVRHDAIERNPVRDAAPIRTARKRVRTLDADQLAALRTAVSSWRRGSHQHGPRPDGQTGEVIEVILGTSARIGEALALRRCDVDLTCDPPTVTISGTLVSRANVGLIWQSHPKHSKHWRVIAVPSFTVAALRSRCAALGDVDGEHPLFSTRNGTFITPNNFRRQLRAILAAADLPDGIDLDALTPHVLRKTVATAINGGASAALAAELLGHSSTAITETFYIQPTTRVDPTTAGILERLAPIDPDPSGPLSMW